MRDEAGWIRTVLGPSAGPLTELFVLSAFVNVIALSVPIFVLQVYDRVVFHAGLATLTGLTAGMGLVLLFDLLFRQTRARLLQRAALKIDVSLNKRLYEKFAALPLRVLESRPHAAWMAHFRDIEAVRNAFSGSTALLIVDLPFALVFLAVIWLIATPVAWVVTLALPVFVLLTVISSWRLTRLGAKEREAGQSRDGFLSEMLAGRQSVKAMAMAEPLRERFEARTASQIQSAIERGRATDSLINLGTTLTLAVTVVMTAVGAIAIIDQKMTIGALIAANILSARTIQPFTQLVAGWRVFAAYREASKRLRGMLDLPVERDHPPFELERPTGEIRIENVSFSFTPGGPKVLDDVAVGIRPGGLHALIGRNGSGKTTLLKLIQGLYTAGSGRITIDGADVAQVARSQIAKWVGYAPAEPFLFDGSIRDNIAMARPEATDEEVIDAARAVGAHEYIVDLPDGYATEVGEGGSRLSSGQRQRIVLARAMIHDPPILLLDEPSHTLDRDSEQALARALVELAKTRCVIAATHSPGLVEASADVIALDRGRVLAAGPTREVLAPGNARPAPRPVQGDAS